MTRLRQALLAVVLGIAALPSAVARAADEAPSTTCVNEEEKKKLLNAKRGRRADQREFVKMARHELTLRAGYYVSDLLDGTYIVGIAYTYHLTEDVGVEASFGFSQVRSAVAKRLEQDRAVTILPPEDRVFHVFTDLVWSPVHGKLRLFADTVLHFDIYGAAGVGVIDNSTSFGVAGQFGLGSRLLLGRSWAIRLDVRDQVYRQQILTVNQYVNDISFTLGVSLFLPTGL